MFYYLMICTFLLALIVSFVVMKVFSSSINQILARIIHDPILRHGQNTLNLLAWWSEPHLVFVFMTWKNTLRR